MSWVKEVSLSARVWDAQEALTQGFVSEVLPSKDELVKKGVQLAALIASKSPVAVLGTKKLLDWSRDHSVEDGLKMTAVWNSAMLQTTDVQTAV
jgi:Delta3,5-Delta2,4-dienoyl-CoA isomerase